MGIFLKIKRAQVVSRQKRRRIRFLTFRRTIDNHPACLGLQTSAVHACAIKYLINFFQSLFDSLISFRQNNYLIHSLINDLIEKISFILGKFDSLISFHDHNKF